MSSPNSALGLASLLGALSLAKVFFFSYVLLSSVMAFSAVFSFFRRQILFLHHSFLHRLCSLSHSHCRIARRRSGILGWLQDDSDDASHACCANPWKDTQGAMADQALPCLLYYLLLGLGGGMEITLRLEQVALYPQILCHYGCSFDLSYIFLLFESLLDMLDGIAIARFHGSFWYLLQFGYLSERQVVVTFHSYDFRLLLWNIFQQF